MTSISQNSKQIRRDRKMSLKASKIKIYVYNTFRKKKYIIKYNKDSLFTTFLKSNFLLFSSFQCNAIQTFAVIFLMFDSILIYCKSLWIKILAKWKDVIMLITVMSEASNEFTDHMAKLCMSKVWVRSFVVECEWW